MRPTAAELLEAEIQDDDWCTVVGVIVESDERWLERYPTSNARLAEDQARAELAAAGATLKVCGVFFGRPENIDTYAKYTDPDRLR
jgi:hypothetical protein